jgi:hypothetical protein
MDPRDRRFARSAVRAAACDLAHVSAHDAPGSICRACPHSSVAKRSVHDGPGDLDGQTRSQGRNGHMVANLSHPKFFRLVGTKANDTGTVGFKILRLRGDPTIRTSEEKIFRKQLIERIDIGGELRGPEPCLGCNDTWVRITLDNHGQCCDIGTRHGQGDCPLQSEC